MSVLSDRDLNREDGNTFQLLGPTHAPGGTWDGWRLQPASFEVTLNLAPGQLLGYAMPMYGESMGYIDPDDPPAMAPRFLEWDTERKCFQYLIKPGEFLLGSTAERVELTNAVCAAIEGKSSLGRLGLMIHCTARFIDPGWRGRLTLEFFNAAPRPIMLRSGMRVGQVRVELLSSPSERPYGYEGLGSHYQGSDGTVQARSVSVEPPKGYALAADGEHYPSGNDYPV